MPMTTSTEAASGWPWMKDQEVAIADPIPPVNEEDDRPAVKELIEKHRENIDALRESLKDHPLYVPNKHDDLWLVRFLLSQKSLKPALKAARHCLQFRKDMDLDDRDLRSIHVGFDNDLVHPSAKKYVDNCDPGTFRLVVHETCVISYVQYAGFDHPNLLKNLDAGDWLPAFAMISEWSHQWVDYLTRTTGRLTKMIRLMDLQDLALVKNCNPKAAARDGKALNSMEDDYPQLLQALYLIHAPIWIEGPWKTIRPMVPKRVLQKFDFLEPAKKEKDLKKLTKFVDIKKLPSRFGGKCKAWPDDTPPPRTTPLEDVVTDEVET